MYISRVVVRTGWACHGNLVHTSTTRSSRLTASLEKSALGRSKTGTSISYLFCAFRQRGNERLYCTITGVCKGLYGDTPNHPTPYTFRNLLLELLLQHLLEGGSILLEALDTLGQLQGARAISGCTTMSDQQKRTLSLAILSFFNSAMNFSWSST